MAKVAWVHYAEEKNWVYSFIGSTTLELPYLLERPTRGLQFCGFSNAVLIRGKRFSGNAQNEMEADFYTRHRIVPFPHSSTYSPSVKESSWPSGSGFQIPAHPFRIPLETRGCRQNGFSIPYNGLRIPKPHICWIPDSFTSDELRNTLCPSHPPLHLNMEPELRPVLNVAFYMCRI